MADKLAEAVELLPCPFCGDPMVREAGGFGHTSEYQDALPREGRCILRHTYYPGELVALWNTCSLKGDEEMVARAIGEEADRRGYLLERSAPIHLARAAISVIGEGR